MMPAAQPSTDDAIDHALALVELGLRPVPIKPGGKHPPMASWQHAQPDAKLVRNWWNGLYRGHGVGLVMGPQPCGYNLMALDVDAHNPAADGWDALHDLEATHGPLPTTWRSLTGGGGAHILFDAGKHTVRNQQAGGNRIAPGIDVRGDGGQIVVAPTIHPVSLQMYAWEIGCAPWDTTIAPCPAWLLDLVTERPAAPRSDLYGQTLARDVKTSLYGNSDDSPAEMLRLRWDWRHELAAAGWTLAKDGTDSLWTRPGKDRREGHSAVLHGNDVLVVFTTEIPNHWRQAGVLTTDGSGYSFSPFAFYAATRHQGSLRDAGSALRAGMVVKPSTGLTEPYRAESGEVEMPPSVDDDDWSPHDVVSIARAITDGTFVPETPVLLEIEGAQPLLYPGRIHSIFGPPGGGKSWVAAAGVAERLKLGEYVLVIDWEDASHGWTLRLIQLGCTTDDIARLDYRNPASSLQWGIGGGLLDTDTPWTLVVIDSAGEAMAAQGIELADDKGTAAWFQLAKKFTIRTERPAVLMLDHVPKAAGDEPAKYAIGSQRKLAAITGASYRCDTVKEFAKNRPGILKLVVAKDRLGNRTKGSTACEVHVDGNDDRVRMEFRISDAQAAHDAGGTFRPTRLMENVSRFVEGAPRTSRRDIEVSVRGKAGAVRQAIDVLVEEGWMTATPVGPGAKAKVEHVVIRPFREAEPVDNSLYGDASSPIVPLRPASSRTNLTHPKSASSPSSLSFIDRDEGTKHWGEQGDEHRPASDGAVDNLTSPVDNFSSIPAPEYDDFDPI